jgi:hypothetical protein
VRRFTVEERRTRLARRHLLADGPKPDVAGATAQLLGLHATDPATPYLTLWARLPGFGVGDLDHALYEARSVAKHLAMRRTLWVFATADLGHVQPSCSDRVADNERRRLIADLVKCGVTDDGEAWLAAASAAVIGHLAEHGATGAKGLRDSLPQLAGHYDPAPGKTWGGTTPVAPRVLTVLGAQGRIVRGPNDGTWTTSRPRWALTSDWLPGAPQPSALETARATLVRNWLRTFGPATLTDITWWFGNTKAWARAAVGETGAVEVEIDPQGTVGYALPDDLDPEPAVEPWCALLPGLDVTTMGWQARDWYLGAHREQVFDRNGNAGPTAWCDGRVVGGWRQDADGRVEVQLLEDVGTSARKSLQRKADELTAWLDGVRIKPRFPSPLSRSADA